ncbi:hypothetical protein FB567DRAFT_587667 [Paraphoma chrysanthemicola]|uniref:NADH dehydrogenase [ubiquinone] 1 alpha subcomplex subunit n=1 Tax=Paraphoma chrysanthemicola TaxID=798071 RepID=A0A8K0W2X8_9PLEO|nr:hypothetical protein FB567DRAFT_587667 [Paraphoma chrysanthemicola]
MPQGPSALIRAYYQWRMQKFPWRKKWLAGYDLHGNTFWEFKDQLHATRNRRIAKYSRDTHYGDVQVSPSWMQWLRHTRFDAPTLTEQQQDVMRQDRMKVLASQADARWASKPSALDAPDKQQPMQMLQSRDPDSGVVPMNLEQEARDGKKPLHTLDQQSEPRSVQAELDTQSAQTLPPAPAPTPTPEGDPASIPRRKKVKKEPLDSPWGQSEPSKDWQPAGWSPAPAKRA